MTDLRDLIISWQRGWGAARGLPAADDLGPGLRVCCGQLGREIEYFALDEDPSSLRELAERVAAEDVVTWLTVPTTDPDRVSTLLESAGLILLRRSELMMTTDLRTHPRPPAPPGYEAETGIEAGVVESTLRDASGEPGARGSMGLTGEDATADRILTAPEHRRRGLGSTLMGALAGAAVAAGSARGILIASEEGQRLYAKLGWRPAAGVVVAAVPGTVYPS